MTESSTGMRRRGAAATFAAFKHYNYRLWFSGQLVSLAGTWMQSTAQGYLVYQLTNSPAYLGLVGFVGGLPAILFTLFGGVAADRIPRRTLLILTQTGMLVLAFVLAALTFTHVVQPWHILILAFLLGVANSFDAPARTSFVAELVNREDMTNAIALNATMFNIATVVGPSLAGVTYAAIGPAWCFMLNGISFIAVIVALLFMRIQPVAGPARHGSTLGDLSAGLKYAFADRVIVVLTGSVGLISIFAIGVMTLLPAWATEVLHGDVTTNGWLVAARGVGSLISALMLAALGRRKSRGKLWMAGVATAPILLFAFGMVHWLPLSLIMLVGIGWATMLVINIGNALIQSRVADEMRGRVMSFYTLIFFGSMPLGSLFAGSAAERLGEPLTVMICAILLSVFAVAAWFFLPDIRRQE